MQNKLHFTVNIQYMLFNNVTILILDCLYFFQMQLFQKIFIYKIFFDCYL